MLKIKANTLGYLCNMISEFGDEARFKFTENGLDIKIVDPADVAMGVFELRPQEFEEYEIQDPIVVDIGLLKSIIDKIELSDLCTINTVDGKTVFEFGNRSIDITQDDNLRSEPRYPQLRLPVTFKISTKDLKTDLKLCYRFSDSIDVGYDSGIITFESTEDTKFKSCYEIEEHSESQIGSRFSLDYFEGIISTLQYKKQLVCDSVVLCLGNDFPILIKGNPTENFSFTLMIAPRIEGFDNGTHN